NPGPNSGRKRPMEPLVRAGTIHAAMRSASIRYLFALITAVNGLAVAASEQSSVVINEIMYHPPGDREDLQFIELFNAGKTECDLSGWRFTKGAKFTFPDD